jgi:hypothetical protein
MRKAIYITFILFSSLVVGQQKKIEKLFFEIDNTQMSVVEKGGNFKLEMKSKAGKKLIRKGKILTPKLINLLNDPKKGLIAHYILSQIWKNNWGQSSCGGNEKPTLNEITYIIYNGLRIEINPDRSVYSKNEYLTERKFDWEHFQKMVEN